MPITRFDRVIKGGIMISIECNTKLAKMTASHQLLRLVNILIKDAVNLSESIVLDVESSQTEKLFHVKQSLDDVNKSVAIIDKIIESDEK